MSIENQIEKRQHDNDLMETNDEDQNSSLGNNNNDDHEQKELKFVYTLEEKKLLRKINITTVPFICAITFLQVSMTGGEGYILLHI